MQVEVILAEIRERHYRILGGIEATSYAFERNVFWAPIPLAVAATLFAFSTSVSWSYYGLKGWSYLVGQGRAARIVFNSVFCLFVALGCVLQLDAILDFSDALVFLICIPNLIGLYILGPEVRRRLADYTARGWPGDD